MADIRGKTYHDVESAKLFNGKIYGTLYLSLDPNVGLDCDGLDVRVPCRDQSCYGFSTFEIDIDQEDVRSLRSEQQG